MVRTVHVAARVHFELTCALCLLVSLFHRQLFVRAHATGADFLARAVGEAGPLEVGKLTSGAGWIKFSSTNTIAVIAGDLRTFATDRTDARHEILEKCPISNIQFPMNMCVPLEIRNW